MVYTAGRKYRAPKHEKHKSNYKPYDYHAATLHRGEHLLQPMLPHSGPPCTVRATIVITPLASCLMFRTTRAYEELCPAISPLFFFLFPGLPMLAAHCALFAAFIADFWALRLSLCACLLLCAISLLVNRLQSIEIVIV